MNQVELEKLSYELHQLMLSMHNKLFDPAELSKHANMPFSHIKVLFYIAKHSACSISEVADILSISRSNMTPIIEKLSDERFINRYPDSKDRRIYRVELTEKGCKFISELEEITKKIISAKLSSFNRYELDKLYKSAVETNSLLSKIKKT